MLQSVSSLKCSFMLLWIPLSPVTITERTSIKTLSWITWRWVKKPHTDGEKERRKISSLQELFTSTAVEYSIHALCRWTQALLEEDCFLIWIFWFFTDHIKGGLAVWEFIQKQWMCHLWGHFAIASSKGAVFYPQPRPHQPDGEAFLSMRRDKPSGMLISEEGNTTWTGTISALMDPTETILLEISTQLHPNN